MPVALRLSLLFSIVFGISILSHAQGHSCEVVPVKVHKDSLGGHDLLGYITYQIWFRSDNPEDVVSAFYGIPDTSFYFFSANPIWQDRDFGAFSGDKIQLNPALVEKFPALPYDSWFTIGKQSKSDVGSFQAISSGNIVETFDLFERKGGQIISEDLVFYCMPGAENAKVGEDGKVLLGQITARGDFNGGLGIQILEGGDFKSLKKAHFKYTNKANPHYGCLDAKAENFNPDADTEDRSCKYRCTLEIDSIRNTPDYCGKKKGMIEVFIKGAQGTTNFTLNDQTYVSGKFTRLSGGNYPLHIIDNAGCELEDSITVKSMLPLKLVMHGQRLPNPGKMNGKIDLNVSGGNEPLLYQWTQNETQVSDQKNIKNIGEGIYKVKVSDSQGCSLERNFIVKEK